MNDCSWGEDSLPGVQVGRDGWHGVLTYNILFNRMAPLDILYAPEKCTMRFTWYASIPGDEVPPVNYQDNMLFLCHGSIAPSLLERYPSCFCIVSVKDGEDFSWIERARVKARVLIFAEKQRFYYYDNMLQVLFANHLLWHREMDRIVYSGGMIDELIEASAGILQNFVCVTDTGFNLMDYSRSIEPCCAEHVYLIKNGCLSERACGYLKEHILPLSSHARKVIVSKPNDERLFPLLHCPLYIDGQYLFHVVMECVEGTEEACKDVFDEFMKRVTAACTAYWRGTVNVESPWHRVLKALIGGQSMTDDYLNLQLKQTDIPSARQFRLAIAPFEASIGNQKRNEILSAAFRMNDGCVYPFMHEDDMLLLFYSKKEGDGLLSSKTINDSVEKILLEPFGVRLACSQSFVSIRDIPYAFKQAKIALRYRKALEKENYLYGDEERISVYPFDHVLKYYLLSGDYDSELVEYSFKSSILHKLVEEDAEEGTEIAHLLWIYLSCDRNATETAKRVHVHRNTVLYHVARIEKRFGLDFSSPMLRERMILDYIKIIFENEL